MNIPDLESARTTSHERSTVIRDWPSLASWLKAERTLQTREAAEAARRAEPCDLSEAYAAVSASSLGDLPRADQDAATNYEYGALHAYETVLRHMERFPQGRHALGVSRPAPTAPAAPRFPMPATSTQGERVPATDLDEAASGLRDLVDQLRDLEAAGQPVPPPIKIGAALALRLMGNAPPYEPNCDHTDLERIWADESSSEGETPIEGVCLACTSVLHGHEARDTSTPIWDGPVSLRADDNPGAGVLAGLLTCHACDRDAVRLTPEGPACTRHQ